MSSPIDRSKQHKFRIACTQEFKARLVRTARHAQKSVPEFLVDLLEPILLPLKKDERK